NLVVNARDAIAGSGRVRLVTSNVELGDKRAIALGIAPGRYVALSVQDNGAGMPEEVLERAFEPFYTTKEVGKGSGLGLSQVFGFVTQSGGAIELKSRPGQGTTATLYLPSVREREGAREAAGDAPRARRASNGTVLVVEDDPDVLDAAIETVRSLGYDVLTAGDARAALEILGRNIVIDVLFSDVIMPRGIDGVQLAQQASRLRP